ncbi:unnamed protein product [Stenotrophomonas maltophilia]|nr:hypothetical protein [Stenotrophomonas maltophilia]CRX70497.1 unnamed protein product [Stenotrophomonas maltophilia]
MIDGLGASSPGACDGTPDLSSTMLHIREVMPASGFIDSGIVRGLDEGDPELIYRFSGS